MEVQRIASRGFMCMKSPDFTFAWCYCYFF